MKKEQQTLPKEPVPAQLVVKTKIRAGRSVTADPPEPD